MRKHLDIIESFEPKSEEDVTDPTPMADPDPLRSDLMILAERLREYMAPENGDEAVGVETGMQRAADMLDNVLRRNGVK